MNKPYRLEERQHMPWRTGVCPNRKSGHFPTDRVELVEIPIDLEHSACTPSNELTHDDRDG